MNQNADTERQALTRSLAERVVSIHFAELHPDIVLLAKQCLLDYIGVTLAGVSEPVTQLIYAEMAEQGGSPQASVYGFGEKLPSGPAAVINGTAAHALDFDDVNIALPGHPSAALFPGLLALAEQLNSRGDHVITAFVAGYEVACAIGLSVSPGHYNVGFHATGTIGSIAAGAACSRLLGLNVEQTCQALGIAGTQAAGLKSMFGTMCKPLHAGKSSYHGLLAAKLAARGFIGRPDLLECDQGFCVTHGPDFNPDKALQLLSESPGTFLRSNLFKFHAACYLTHSTIEAVHYLQRIHALKTEDVARITLQLDKQCASVCNILAPATGLEAKFSLRLTAAMALAGKDTGRLHSYTDQLAQDPQIVALRDKVSLDFQTGWKMTRARVMITLQDGRQVEAEWDSGVALNDLQLQQQRLEAKFYGLLETSLEKKHTGNLLALINRFETMERVAPLAELCVVPVASPVSH